ncbi:MAG TPA: hypothetical protein VEV43_09195 [Actinomycetota bacterium]|nr:hypothetical protein [Actinomycetota bacterium]
MRALRVPIVIGLLFATLWLVGSAAAQPKPKYPPPRPSVLPTLIPSSPPERQASTPPFTMPPPASEPPNVPFTGADVTLYAVIGVGLTAAGTTLVRVARRRSS